ncbi:MAG: DUF6094 domain-containing protein, partial [Ktedonobacteraceae bacterium]
FMARTEAKIKLGFYPTPPLVVRAVAPYLTAFQRNASFRLLDPCAGDGKALALLASEMARSHERLYGRYADFHATTWAIEPQAYLARQANEVVDHLLEASFFTTTLSNGESQDHGWQVCWLNPPYDVDNETGGAGRKMRQEISFLMRATDKLCAQGILVFIVPQNILRRAAQYLAGYYEHLTCYRFPDESWRPPNLDHDISMYEQFHQILVIARRRMQSVPPDPAEVRRIEGWSESGTLLAPLPLEANLALPSYTIPNAPSVNIRSFLKNHFDPDAAACSVGHFSSKTRRPIAGAWASEDYWSARLPDPQKTPLSIGHPLQKFKRGYLATFAAAGIADRTVLTSEDGRRILVKGRTRKTTHYFTNDDGEAVIEKTTDRFESSLQCMDLDTGDLLVVQTGKNPSATWGITYESMTLSAFLTIFGASVMREVMQHNAPRYRHHSQVPWASAAFAKVQRAPLGKQIDTVLAQVHSFVNRWQGGDIDDGELLTRIGEIAEMASGKTYMAIVTAFLGDLYACGCVEMATKATKVLHLFPAIVLTPPIMARKWKREIEQTLPNARVVIVERFGPTRDEADDDEEIVGSHQSNAANNYRAFEPDFPGTSLGTVGIVERVVA